jgi:hypothetical protein
MGASNGAAIGLPVLVLWLGTFGTALYVLAGVPSALPALT